MPTWMRDKFSFHFDCQWLALLRPSRYNWYDFTFIALDCEYKPHGPMFEINFGAIGFHFWFSFALPWETEASRKLHALRDEAMADISKLTPA